MLSLYPLKDKKGFVKMLTLLLAILLIVVEFKFFYIIYGNTLEPITFAITEIPNNNDNNLALINLLRTSYKEGNVADIIIYAHSTDSYDKIKEVINEFINNYYGEGYFWDLNVNGEKELDNYGLVEGIGKRKIYSSSIMVPTYSKEVIEVELLVYKD